MPHYGKCIFTLTVRLVSGTIPAADRVQSGCNLNTEATLNTRTNLAGSALFVTHPYVDFVMKVRKIPSGDEKTLAEQSVVSFGGNAFTAALCCNKLGLVPDVIGARANDILARMIEHWVAESGVYWHPRLVRSTSYSVIFPSGDDRAMVRHRDEEYLQDFPLLNIDGCRLVHGDGLQCDALLHYFDEARKRGILTSLDGGSLRPHMREILRRTDVAVVSLRLCQQMNTTPSGMLSYLRSLGCKVGGVTLGEQGMLWYEGRGSDSHLPALAVPSERIKDSNGVGDVFHGAYCWSYLQRPDIPWYQHFEFSRAAAAHKLQHFGNEAGLPSCDEVELAQTSFKEKAA